MNSEILYRFLRCETSPEEEALIANWLESDDKHRRKLDALQLTMEGLSLLAPKIERGKAAIKPRNRFSINRGWRYIISLTAVSLIAFVASYYIIDNKLKEWSEASMSFTVPSGQRINIKLPDGTSVWLNSKSVIEYPAVFSSDTRKVKISGEAMFDVTHNDKRPFVVETFACDVEVLGTEFNIDAEEETNRFSAALISGSVKVVDRIDNDLVVLKPNQKVSLVNGVFKIDEIDNYDEYRWPEGLISLKSDSFESLMVKFEKYYGVTIKIERNNMPLLNYGGKIHISEGIEYALKILQKGSDFSYCKNHETNEITIK